MKEYYEYFGRKTLLINLDPANEFSDKVNKIKKKQNKTK
jgi:hypothetical protein